jgi:hypothetical protein
MFPGIAKTHSKQGDTLPLANTFEKLSDLHIVFQASSRIVIGGPTTRIAPARSTAENRRKTQCLRSEL